MLKIEVEGTDGAGKTTALKYLIEQLQAKGSKVLETREVGSPLIPINVELRKTVLSPDSGLSGEAMELIFAAMRFENDKLYNKVGKDYDFIISDRGWLSHLAYTDHNVNEEFTKELYLDFLASHTQMPDVVIYFSVNTETALKRRVSRGEGMDVIEAKGVEFQELVRNSFEKYIDDQSMSNTTVFIVDANQDIEGVRLQVNEIIEHLLTDEKEESQLDTVVQQ
jgi:dTMP kinase